MLAYYRAISIGPSYNYYFGRAESDIIPWVEYFIEGMACAFEKVVHQMLDFQNKGKKDHSDLMRTLDPKQRQALELFQNYEVITSNQMSELFGFQTRTSTALCKKWVESGFLEIVDPSKKARKYRLAKPYDTLIESHL